MDGLIHGPGAVLDVSGILAFETESYHDIYETRYITLLSKYVFVILLTLQATNVHGNVTNVEMYHARNGVQYMIHVGIL